MRSFINLFIIKSFIIFFHRVNIDVAFKKKDKKIRKIRNRQEGQKNTHPIAVIMY